MDDIEKLSQDDQLIRIEAALVADAERFGLARDARVHRQGYLSSHG